MRKRHDYTLREEKALLKVKEIPSQSDKEGMKKLSEWFFKLSGDRVSGEALVHKIKTLRGEWGKKKKRKLNRWTDDEERTLQEIYSRLRGTPKSLVNTYNMFRKQHGSRHSFGSVKQKCQRLASQGIEKTVTGREIGFWVDGKLKWSGYAEHWKVTNTVAEG